MTRCKNVSRHLGIKNSLLEVLEDFLPGATMDKFNGLYVHAV